MGKRSTLNYKNIMNDKNMEYVYTILSNSFDQNNNVIYTGTLIINPNQYRLYYDKILEVIKLHNALDSKGGLYKLFTMSILNLAYHDVIQYFDDILDNIVDLGYKTDLSTDKLDNCHVLDWSGMFKPWFVNGLYREYWKKHNLIYDKVDYVEKNRDTVEKFS